MKRIALVHPFPFSVEDNSTENEGYRIMQAQTDADYDLRIVSSGDELNENSTKLHVRVISGQPGGNHLVRKSPPASGYMPANMAEPFRISLSTEDSPGYNDWYGTVNLFVRDYKDMPFNIRGDSSTYRSITFKNSRMFSYHGDLYFLTESRGILNGRFAYFVNLFRWDETNDEFNLVKMFDRFPSTPETAATTQLGSPDYCIYDDEVYIAYKFNDIENGAQRIVVQKASDDLTSWELVNDFELKGLAADSFSRFRLRFATGGDSMLIVVYMIADVEEATGYSIEKHDMRSYASYDAGRSFKTLNKTFSNIRKEEDQLLSTQSVTNMADMFLPEFTSGRDASAYDGFSVNFDLYYDDTMASYVVLKPADINKATIIGIKTIDDSFLRWENCLNLELDVNRTVTHDNTSIVDPNDFSDVTDDYNEYIPLDLCVVPGSGTNKLVYTALRDPDEFGFTSPLGVGVAEFKFVSKDRIPPGLYDTVFAYGGKHHPTFNFICGPFNFNHGGLFGTGNPTTFPFDWLDQPVGCEWRNQLVASVKIDKGEDSSGTLIDEFSCFAIMGPYQNYDEKSGYEYAYCKSLGSLNAHDMSPTSSSGTFTWDSTDTKYNQFSVGVGGHAYYDIEADATVNNQHIMERASLSSPFFFKVKWQMGIDNATNSVTFMRAAAASTTGLTAELTANADGSFVVKDFAGTTLVTTAPIVDWSANQKHEFILGSTHNRSRANTLWMLYRAVGEDQWNIAFQESNSVVSASPTFRVGFISGDENNQVNIGDLQISSMGQGYVPITGPKKKASVDWVDGGGLYTSTPGNYDDPHWSPTVDIYDPQFEFKDGSKIQITGPKISPDLGTTWIYGKSKTRSDATNLIDGVANFAFDFTNLYNEPIGSPYCHCYNDMSPLTGGQHSDEGQLIVFENTRKHLIDTVALINMAGIHCFQVIFGTYDAGTDTWSGESVEQYSVPRIILDVESSVGNKILITDEFAPQQLREYDVMVYDTLNEYYTEQLRVKKNFDQFIEFESAVPSLTNRELHLMHKSHSWDVDPTIASTEYSHIGVRLFRAQNANLSSVGQVVFGKLMEIEDYVTTLNVTERSVEDLVEGDFGFKFATGYDDAPVAEEYSFTLPLIHDKNIANVRNFVENAYVDGQSFPFIAQDNEGNNVTKYGVIVAPSIVPNQRGHDINFGIAAQGFKTQPRSQAQNEAPVISTALIRPTDVEVGDSVFFSALATDPEGETVSYEWDFGDGTTSTSQSPSHTYSEVGEYEVSLTVSDPDGAARTKTGLVVVSEFTGDRLFIQTTNTEPLTASVAEEVTVSVFKPDNTVATSDSSTKIKAVSLNIEIDMDSDGSFDQPEDEEYFAVVDGQHTFDIRATAGTYTLTVYSSDGMSVTKEIEFA